MEAHLRHSLCKAVIVCCHHTAFTGGHGFCSIETENTNITDGSGKSQISWGREGVCAIFDYVNTMFFCNLHYAFHVAYIARNVNRNNGNNIFPFFAIKNFFNAFRINGVVVLFNVCKVNVSIQMSCACCS